MAGVAVFVLAGDAWGAVSSVALFSESNQRIITFHVYTPPGYSASGTTKYPTVYSLHGIGGTSSQRASTYAPTLDAKMNAGEMSPMIWIFGNGQTNSFYGDAYDGHKQVYSNIIDEVVPYVDATYRTFGDREHRAMEGFSMGGFGAALYAAKHPELFSAVVEYGGALSTWTNLTQSNAAVAQEMYDTVESHWLPYSLWDATTTNAAAIKALVNYKMIVGDEDPLYHSNVRFRDHLISLGIDPQFHVAPGVSHAGGEYVTDGSGLAFLHQHFATVGDTTGDFDGDEDADGNDFLLWQRQLGQTVNLSADGNGDDKVDVADLFLWKGEFGSHATAAAATVPEPRAAALLAFGALFGALRALARPAAESCDSPKPASRRA